MRIHAAELLDQGWFPEFVRRPVLEALEHIWRLSGLYRLIVPLLNELLAETGSDTIIDLCSGTGGPLPSLAPHLRTASGAPPRIIFTDLFGVKAGCDPLPVDARNVPENLRGLRTMFASFHHFRPEEARAILADAAAKKQPIFIAEMSERSLRCGAVVVAATLAGGSLLSPFVRPVNALRVVLSTLLPVVPLTLCFDGLVSCLRTYSPAELAVLTEGLGESYIWEPRKVRRGSLTLTVLRGRPAS